MGMNEIRVRAYTEADYDAVERCIYELQEDEWLRDKEYWHTPEHTKGTYLEYALKSVKESEGEVLVAEVGSKVVGFAVTLLSNKEDSPSIALERFGYVMDIAVLREWQSKGAGRALMAAAEDVIKKKGIGSMYLDVSEGNKALEFYKALGYKQQSVRLRKKLS